MVTFDTDKLSELLESLKDIPNIKEVKALRKRLRKEQQKLQQAPMKRKPVKIIPANELRSSKMKRYHRYIRLIRDNFPNLSYNEIKKQFAKRRQGFDVDIPDAVWQNPSP